MTIEATAERKTSADIVSDALYNQIITLDLMPGTKISEVDIAKKFGVSRQPVREAFTRLGSMGLLRIQPQRATVVQNFSLSSIANARFVRLALEIEVAKEAINQWTPAAAERFSHNLTAQQDAVARDDTHVFHSLDEEFHRLIAEVAQKPAAFALLMQKKALINRICVLSLKDSQEMEHLVQDHFDVFHAMMAGDPSSVEKTLRLHLSRIEKTIESVQVAHPEYFQD